MRGNSFISNSDINMKTGEVIKLLLKAVIFIVILAMIDRCAGLVYYWLEDKALKHSPYGMVTEYSMEKVNNDVVIIGASEAKHSYVCSAIRDSLSMSVYNCAKDGKRFYYQNAIVNGILDRYSPKLIIWSVGPNFLSTPSREDKDGISDLNPWYRSNRVCKDAILLKSRYENIKMLSYLYAFNSKFVEYVYKCLFPDYQYEYGGYAPLYGEMKNEQIDMRKFKDDLDLLCLESLNKTLARCKRNSVDVVFVYTTRFERGPYESLSQYEALNTAILNSGYKVITEIYRDESLMNPMYFKDPAHLNNDGAIRFTNLLINKLRIML